MQLATSTKSSLHVMIFANTSSCRSEYFFPNFNLKWRASLNTQKKRELQAASKCCHTVSVHVLMEHFCRRCSPFIKQKQTCHGSLSTLFCSNQKAAGFTQWSRRLYKILHAQRKCIGSAVVVVTETIWLTNYNNKAQVKTFSHEKNKQNKSLSNN